MSPPLKKRKRDSNAVEEVVFDPSARAEYLTGFHKRKLQRIKHAQEEAVKKEKAEKLSERARLREQRKQDLKKHVETVNALIRQAGKLSDDDDEEDDDDGWEGIQDGLDGADEPMDHEDEYIDEDRYTMVTVESIDVTKEGLTRSAPLEGQEDSEGDVDGAENASEVQGRGKTAGGRTEAVEKTSKPKKKKKKFRYLSKVERKATRMKERSGNKVKAKARRE